MRPPIYVREITEEEREGLTQALRSSDAFRMRRAQMILASSRGERASQIGRTLGCDDQTVRDALTAFDTQGLGALERQSRAPHRTPHKVLMAPGIEQIRALVHRSPREFGHATSLWTLDLVAEEAARQGITARRLTAEAIRVALLQAGIHWKRAKHWITSPDPEYERKKGGATV